MRVRMSLVGVMAVGAVAAVFVMATQASAHKRFAKKEGVECKECHVNPEGGGARNVVGQYYGAKAELPLDRSPETMKLMRDTVDRWMMEVMGRPPPILWPHKKLEELPAPAQAPVYERASDAAIARRMSLDLRGTMPTPEELTAIVDGKMTLERYTEVLLSSRDFQTTFSLYHRDLIRPRTGDYNTDASYSMVQAAVVDGTKVWTSSRMRGELGEGKCGREQRVRVSPWWDRAGEHYACADTASAAPTAMVNGKSVRCDTLEGQMTGSCGCGPYMLFCYVAGQKDQIISSMRAEGARMAMEIINHDEPYSELLTADWTVLDGPLEVFYAKLDDRLLTLSDPDAKKPPRRVMRDARHAGILSSPMMLNFFYNGRRWAQRTFETFFCHDVFPDYDMLDDHRDAGGAAVPYRDSPLLEPSLTVAELRPCAACHLQLDGLARVKDRWDPFGRYYEKTANGYDIPQKAIFLGQEVDGLDGFGKALGASEVFHDCAANQLWEHMTGHRFRPEERDVRVALVREFQAKNLNFKDLIRAIVKTDAYRSTGNVKIMTRELYTRAMGRATDVAWKIGEKGGFDVFYDKVGGMDYRKIEMRDKRPGTGHSLVQLKGAQESCAELVDRDVAREGRRLYVAAEEPKASPSDKELDDSIRALYLRGLARPWVEVTDDEISVLRTLFRAVEKKTGALDAYKAMCVGVYGSEDFALF